MKPANNHSVLISGASIAGLTAAYWLTTVGYQVTIVERAPELRRGGVAVNVQGDALAVVKRMGLFEQLCAHRLQPEKWEFKNADDETERSITLQDAAAPATSPEDIAEIEIERDKLLAILTDAVQDKVEWLFNNRITALHEAPDALHVTLAQGAARTFALVLGCDGLHSGVRSLWFGPEAQYAHFLHHYFSLTVVNELLLPPNTLQLYNVPGKVIMLNAYHQKTDIVFCFYSEQELPYDYRDTEQQKALLVEQFADQGWRATELLAAVAQAGTAYFDKFCQINMPSWTKGRVALVGDAAYCASPAAGVGASMAIIGAATLADALAEHPGNIADAFRTYHHTLRPFVEEVQDTALTMLSTMLVPRTEEAIRARNAQAVLF